MATRFGATALIGLVAVALAGCSETAGDEIAKVPPIAIPVQKCLEDGGATVVSTDNFGQILTVIAESGESSARIVVSIFRKTHTVVGGEEFTEPAEAMADLDWRATAADKALASECAELR